LGDVCEVGRLTAQQRCSRQPLNGSPARPECADLDTMEAPDAVRIDC